MGKLNPDDLHSLATLVRLASTGLDPPFAFRTALILRGIDSKRCWKYSSEILVHIDMIASRSRCRFVGCESPVPPHPKCALLD